jgi:hypothetical protein
MKTIKHNIIGTGIAMAVALAFALAIGIAVPVQMQAADQVKGAQLLMKPIKTSEDIGKLEPGDMIAMSCPKCKSITITHVQPTFKATEPKETATQKHLCPGCETTIETVGVGKAGKLEVKHVCKTCGSEDAFCCVMKKGSLPTKGMEKK